MVARGQNNLSFHAWTQVKEGGKWLPEGRITCHSMQGHRSRGGGGEGPISATSGTEFTYCREIGGGVFFYA